MLTFLQAYFWLMVVYLLATVVGMLLKSKKLAAASISPAMWAEQVASYAFLFVGLVGVYGHIHSVPFLAAWFWQVFLVVLALFAALQHRMPKTRLLRKTHGAKAVVIASVVGAILLVPLFIAVGIYGFSSAALWA
jgi:hypothetical protein